jgi:hypothetical protein
MSMCLQVVVHGGLKFFRLHGGMKLGPQRGRLVRALCGRLARFSGLHLFSMILHLHEQLMMPGQ